ncbi:MAG: hypothetical protein WBD31_27495 [Rubripirellula sp.]
MAFSTDLTANQSRRRFILLRQLNLARDHEISFIHQLFAAKPFALMIQRYKTDHQGQANGNDEVLREVLKAVY